MRTYFFNFLGIACAMPMLAYFLLWRFDLSKRLFFELHAVAVAAIAIGFVAYWFWLRKAVGPAKCLAIGLIIHAVGFLGIGAAYDIGLLFAATAVLFIAAPANLQYLYINGVVPPEKQGRLSGGIQIVGAVAAALGLALGYSLWLGLKTSAEKGTRRTKRDFQAAAPFFAAAAALILASISLHKVVTLERDQREGSRKKEYNSVEDEWVHQRVTESESDDESVEALTVRTPLQ